MRRSIELRSSRRQPSSRCSNIETAIANLRTQSGRHRNTHHPPRTKHTPDSLKRKRRDAGISERLIRVAVGIEAAEDLCADFEQALRGVKEEKQHANQNWHVKSHA